MLLPNVRRMLITQSWLRQLQSQRTQLRLLQSAVSWRGCHAIPLPRSIS